MKKWTKFSRRFIGNADCMAAVSWRCHAGPHWNHKKNGKWQMEAEFGVTEEGRHHYISRKADMKPLYRFRDELNRFIELAEQALDDEAKANAKS